MTIDAIASEIYNDVMSGLRGITSNPTMSIEQLKDEVVAERNIIMREYLLKGIINLNELFLAINCIEVKCESMSKCNCIFDGVQIGETALHFEIPPIVYLNGIDTIKFIGSIDRKIRYNVYTDEAYRFHQYKKRGAQEPYVYIDTAINGNGNMDGYIFNAPFVKYISIIALFLDPRRLLEWDCCANNLESYLDCGILSDEIQKRLTEKKVRLYRQLLAPALPNTQISS